MGGGQGVRIREKMEAVEAYLRELGPDPCRVRSLTVWSWIELATRTLPAHYATASK